MRVDSPACVEIVLGCDDQDGTFFGYDQRKKRYNLERRTRNSTINILISAREVILSMKSIIGDYQAFFSLQLERLKNVHIDISGCEISHLAYRTKTYDEYLRIRERIEKHCISNIENVWNGRPISIMQLEDALDLGAGLEARVIELIPPVHRRVYKMGLEHVGVVIGDSVDEFSRKHRAELTGQQFQSELCEPYYVTFFDDFTMVKFYRIPLLEVCETERRRRYEGFAHVENWNPSS